MDGRRPSLNAWFNNGYRRGTGGSRSSGVSDLVIVSSVIPCRAQTSLTRPLVAAGGADAPSNSASVTVSIDKRRVPQGSLGWGRLAGRRGACVIGGKPSSARPAAPRADHTAQA